jgi:two-component system, chemotaxis family, response regulator WspR
MAHMSKLELPDLDQSSDAPDGGAVLVLLVDDQAMIGEAIRRALANHSDIAFHYCAVAEDAVAIAQRIDATVILQDLVMPDTDGLTLVRQYRANPATRDIPIIVLSSKDEGTVKSESFAAGANDYLVKLPDKVELVARVRYHSRAYTILRQRDAAYRALRESQRKLVELNLELQRLNRVDGLTGLSNRSYLDEVLANEWSRATREQSPLSVLMIDIDDFKKYNDTHGHVAGDVALRKVAGALRLQLKRPADLAARFGGEEFTAILPTTPVAGARSVAESIRAAVEALAIPHGNSTVGSRLTLSIGGATMIPGRGTAYLRLVEAADRALYQAKRNGKNRVVTEDREAPAVVPATIDP